MAGRKLSTQDVDEIKRDLLKGHTQKAIASRYGVSRGLISNITQGLVHAKIGPDVSGIAQANRRNNNRRNLRDQEIGLPENQLVN